MKTLEVLSASEAELSARLKEMKIKELELHAKKILVKLGQDNFDGVMSAVIKLLPTLENEGQDRFQEVKSLIRSKLPVASNDSEEASGMLERLSIIIVVLITKKFQKIHKERK